MFVHFIAPAGSHPSLITVLRYAQNNSGCAVSQVAYLVDGGSKVSCGQCRPGETGLGFADIAAELSLVLSLANYDPSVEAFPFQSGALFSCATNEFCTDAAICAPLVSSPLFGLPCPLEAPSDNWCGPGLHCIAHRCQICSEGAMDITRSRLCLHGIWTSDPWTLATRDPCAWALAGILALLLLQLVVLIFGAPYQFHVSEHSIFFRVCIILS